MNVVAARLLQEIDQDVQRHGGQQAFHAFALRHLNLKTVVKESHGAPIQALAFNQVPDAPSSRSEGSLPSLRNLFATVGGDQATVYDDAHMGDYMAVVAHFCNTRTPHHAGGGLSVCAWVNAHGLVPHPQGDAWLAVAGADPTIQILSVTEARIIAQCTGHTTEVVCLSAAKAVPGLLLSLSRDGHLRLWDLRGCKGGGPAAGGGATSGAGGGAQGAGERCATRPTGGEGVWGGGATPLQGAGLAPSPAAGLWEGLGRGNPEPWAPGVRCLMSLSTDASAAELHPLGRCFVTGHRNGRIRLWHLPLVSWPEGGGRGGPGAGDAPHLFTLPHTYSHPTQPPLQPGTARQPEDKAEAGGSGAAVWSQLQAPGWFMQGTSPAHGPQGGGAGHIDGEEGGHGAPAALAEGVPQAGPMALPAASSQLPLDPLGITLNPPGPLMETVDCLLFLRPDRLAGKACDGRTHVWSLQLPQGHPQGGHLQGRHPQGGNLQGGHPQGGNPQGGSPHGGHPQWGNPQGPCGAHGQGAPAGPAAAVAAAPAMQLLSCMRVAGGGSSSLRSRITLGATLDGSHLCVGSSSGDVAVYEAVGGAKVALLGRGGRSGSGGGGGGGKAGVVVRCCGLSHDCRHLVAAAGGGYLLRWEYAGSGQGADHGSGPEAGKVDSGAGVGKAE